MESWVERGTYSKRQWAILEKHLWKLSSVFPCFHAHVDMSHPPPHKLIVKFSCLCKSVWCIQGTFYLKLTYPNLLVVKEACGKKERCDYPATIFQPILCSHGCSSQRIMGIWLQLQILLCYFIFCCFNADSACCHCRKQKWLKGF